MGFAGLDSRTTWVTKAASLDLWPYLRSQKYMEKQLTLDEIVFILLVMKNAQKLYKRLADAPGGYRCLATQTYLGFDKAIRRFLTQYYDFELALPEHDKYA